MSIHVELLSMSVDSERKRFEDLLNKAESDKSVQIMDTKHNADVKGGMYVYVVWKDVLAKNVALVKISEEEYPRISDFDNGPKL